MIEQLSPGGGRYRFRYAGYDDLPALRALAAQAQLPSLSGEGPVRILLDEGRVLCAVDGDKLVGCCAWRRNVVKRFCTRQRRYASFRLPNTYLCAMFVDPEYRHRSLGSQLYALRLELSTRRQEGPVYVELLGDGTPNSVHHHCRYGRQFYQRNGFVGVGYSDDPDGGEILALPPPDEPAGASPPARQCLPFMRNAPMNETADARPENDPFACGPEAAGLRACDPQKLLQHRQRIDLPEARAWFCEYLKSQGIPARVALAMATVPRHAFVPPESVNFAYLDRYLWTADTVLSTPRVVGMMLAQLELNPLKRVLEIGTGTGYQTCVLALLAGHVCSIDRVPNCVREGEEAVAALGVGNVSLKIGDGYAGWPEAAPFDAIIAATTAAELPLQLFRQLNPQHGRMVIPLGKTAATQRLYLVRKIGVRPHFTDLGSTYFVPMIASGGMPETPVGGACRPVPRVRAWQLACLAGNENP